MGADVIMPARLDNAVPQMRHVQPSLRTLCGGKQLSLAFSSHALMPARVASGLATLGAL